MKRCSATASSHLLLVVLLATVAFAAGEKSTEGINPAFRPPLQGSAIFSDDNPAARYCTALGYTCEPTSTDANCWFPNGTSCEIWAFFRGTCGQEFSYCETHGKGNTVVRRMDDMGTWCAEYAVCVFPDGYECAEYEYYQGQCKPGQCQSWILSKGGCVNCPWDPEQAPRMGASPPWYGIQRQLTYSIGTFGGVSVSPLTPAGKDYTITVQAMNRDMAQGLANILIPSYDFGPKITVLVKDNTGAVMIPASGNHTAEEVKGWLEAGLTGNPYFYGVESFGYPGQPKSLYLVLAPQVIQYYNDFYLDPQSFAHYVAEDVFAEVIRDEYPGAGTLRFTTASPVAGY